MVFDQPLYGGHGQGPLQVRRRYIQVRRRRHDRHEVEEFQAELR